MAIVSDVLSSDRTGFDKEWVGFRPSLDGSGFDGTGPVTDPLLRDQHLQIIPRRAVGVTLAMMIPRDGALEGRLEAELTRL